MSLFGALFSGVSGLIANSQALGIIRDNIGRSPLYSGRIRSIGPRYCPSVEDKVIKFPHKARHQVFLEPEGRRTREVYVNGLSTSLPADVQTEHLHPNRGPGTPQLMRAGYATDYGERRHNAKGTRIIVLTSPLGLFDSLEHFLAYGREFGIVVDFDPPLSPCHGDSFQILRAHDGANTIVGGHMTTVAHQSRKPYHLFSGGTNAEDAHSTGTKSKLGFDALFRLPCIHT